MLNLIRGWFRLVVWLPNWCLWFHLKRRVRSCLTVNCALCSTAMQCSTVSILCELVKCYWETYMFGFSLTCFEVINPQIFTESPTDEIPNAKRSTFFWWFSFWQAGQVDSLLFDLTTGLANHKVFESTPKIFALDPWFQWFFVYWVLTKWKKSGIAIMRRNCFKVYCLKSNNSNWHRTYCSFRIRYCFFFYQGCVTGDWTAILNQSLTC